MELSRANQDHCIIRSMKVHSLEAYRSAMQFDLQSDVKVCFSTHLVKRELRRRIEVL